MRGRRTGVQVGQGVLGGDAPHAPGIVDQRAQTVDGLHQARRRLQTGGVIAPRCRGNMLGIALAQFIEHFAQCSGRYFRAAAAAGRLLVLPRPPWSARPTRHAPRRQIVKSAHELAVDAVFPAPHPGALRAQSVALGDGQLRPESQQGQKAPLRAVLAQAAPGGEGEQVGGQHRPLAHRVHPGLGPGMAALGGDIAGAEHVGKAGALQRVAGAHKPARVHRQSAVFNPRRGAGAGRPEQRVEAAALALAEMQRARADLDDAVIAVQRHPQRGQLPRDAAARGAAVAGQNPRRAAVQADLRRVLAQAVGYGQRQFHAAGAAADHGNAAPAPRRIFRQGGPAPPQAGHGFYRDRVLTRAGHAVEFRLAADIDRQQFVAQHAAPGAAEAPGLGIEAGHRIVEKAHARPLAQSEQVDMGFLEGVVSGEQARQHARVGGKRRAGDQRDAQAGGARHGQLAQHQRVRMAAAGQHQILPRGLIGAHGLTGGWRSRAGSRAIRRAQVYGQIRRPVQCPVQCSVQYPVQSQVQ